MNTGKPAQPLSMAECRSAAHKAALCKRLLHPCSSHRIWPPWMVHTPLMQEHFSAMPMKSHNHTCADTYKDYRKFDNDIIELNFGKKNTH
jgi:hypothetical protein